MLENRAGARNQHTDVNAASTGFRAVQGVLQESTRPLASWWWQQWGWQLKQIQCFTSGLCKS